MTQQKVVRVWWLANSGFRQQLTSWSLKRQLGRRRLLSVLMSGIVALTGFPTYATPKGPASRLLELESAHSPQVISDIKRHNAVAEALYSRNLNDIPENIIDPVRLRGQLLIDETDKHVYHLGVASEYIPPIVYDGLHFEVKDGGLVIQAIRDERIVGVHVIPNLNLKSVIRSKELVVMLTEEGHIEVIDMGLVILYAFGKTPGPLPVFRAYTRSETSLMELPVQTDNLKIAFLHRGLKPFVEQEVASILAHPETATSRKIIPRDNNGQPLMAAYDVVVYSEHENHREFHGLLSKRALDQRVLEGLTHLGVITMAFAQAGHGQRLGEKIANILQVHQQPGEDDPVGHLLKNLAEQNQKAKSEELIQKLLTGDNLTREYLANTSREEFRTIINRLVTVKGRMDQANSGRPQDLFNMMQWISSFKVIEDQAKKEQDAIKQSVAEIDAQLQSIEKHSSLFSRKKNALPLREQKEALEHRSAQLEQESQDQQYTTSYQSLLRDAHSDTISSTVKEEKVRWYKKLANKTTAKIAAITSSAALGTWAAYHTSDTVATEMTLMLNWAYQHIPEVLLEPSYVWPGLALGLPLLVLVPVYVRMLGTYSIPALKYIQLGIAKSLPMAHGQFKERLRVASSRLKKIVDKYGSMDVLSRLSTWNFRAHGFVAVPLYHSLAHILKQPTLEAMRKGINPFKRVYGNSKEGEILGLDENESLAVGFRNPVKKSAESKAKDAKQMRAIEVLAAEQSRARVLSRNLAALVLLHESKADSQHILELLKGGIDLSDVIKIYDNKSLQKKWDATSTALESYLLHLLETDEGYDFRNLSMDQAQELIRLTQAVVKQPKSATSEQVKQFKVRWSNLSRSTLKGIGNFGLYEFLLSRTLTADKTIAKQQWEEFVSDNFLVAVVYALVGERADLSRPEDLAHQAEFPYVTPPHLADEAHNWILHFFIAGPRRLLTLQAPHVEKEKNYSPIEQLLLEQTVRPESFGVGMYQWIVGLFHFTKTNMGAYYIRDSWKRITTIQAYFISSVFFRLALTDQNFHMASMAFLLVFVWAELAYGWPWTPIGRGTTYEQERVGENRQNMKDPIDDLVYALRSGSDEEIKTELLRVIEQQRDMDGKARKDLKNELNTINSWLSKPNDQALDASNIVKALKDAERSPVFGALSELMAAQRSGDEELAKQAYLRLQIAVQESKDSDGFRALVEELRPYALAAADQGLLTPPRANGANDNIYKVATWGFGAFLTTFLSIPLAVASFDEKYLTWEYVGLGVLATYVVFLPTVFAVTGKTPWEKVYIPSAKKAAAQIKKKKQAVVSWCSSLLKQNNKTE